MNMNGVGRQKISYPRDEIFASQFGMAKDLLMGKLSLSGASRGPKI